MAVNLSPVGGVAAQFFTSTGAVLTGGKLYTYAAGTTTPATTYTTSQGNVAWTNPVELDAAGRVPGSGEIWLTDGVIYKFVLKDSNDVLIATYDNITGINSNAVAYTNSQEIVTATAGQTVFNLGISYQPGTNSLSVFVDGVNQYGSGAQYAYVETDSTTVTFNSGLHVGAEVKFTTTQQQGAGAVDASQVTYDPPFTGSVPTNVEAKLSEYVSVKDFGAAGDGVTDDTVAIQAAIDAIPTSLGGTNPGYQLEFPAGKYKLTEKLIVGNRRISFIGAGVQGSGSSTILFQSVSNKDFIDFTTGNADVISFQSIQFTGTAFGTGRALVLGSAGQACYDSRILNCWFSSIGGKAIDGVNLQACHISDCAFDSATTHGVGLTKGSNNMIKGNTFYGCASAGVYLNEGENNIIEGNQFWLCGSADDITAGVYIDRNGTGTRGNSIIGNTFRACQNDIVLQGNGGTYGANTGVNDTAIIGNNSDRAYRRFLYALDANRTYIAGNKISSPNQDNTVLSTAAVFIGGMSDQCSIFSNSVNIGLAVGYQPAYGLQLGGSTTNSILGANDFDGATADIDVTAGATLNERSSYYSNTWTPSLGGTATYTVREGYFHKTGRLIIAYGKIVVNTIGTGSATTISGLPYSSKATPNDTGGGGTVHYFSGIATSVVSIQAVIPNNASTIYFTGLTAAAATSAGTITVFQNGARVDFMVVYETDD